MKRFILTTVALVAIAAMLGSTNSVDAAPHRVAGHAVTHGHVTVHAHHDLVVRGHSVHVPVHVRGYAGWSSRCWFPGYRTYGYYCGADQAWYYWYAPLNEYLPVAYMSIYPPTPVGYAPVGMVPVTPGLPALPSGATFVPGPITAP